MLINSGNCLSFCFMNGGEQNFYANFLAAFKLAITACAR